MNSIVVLPLKIFVRVHATCVFNLLGIFCRSFPVIAIFNNNNSKERKQIVPQKKELGF